MNKHRPTVFVGSSSEALPVAKRVKKILAKSFECVLWTDDIFRSNDNILQTLLQASGIFDFGIMLLTADDVVVSRKHAFKAPRDNVLFELGIFLGRTGDGKAYALLEDNAKAKLPSDLEGITIHKFSRDKKAKRFMRLEVVARRLMSEMIECSKLGFLGMLPSTALAIGYFENFVKPIASIIGESKNIHIGKFSGRPSSLSVILPNVLDSDIKKKVSVYYRRRRFSEATIRVSERNRPIFAMCNKRKKVIEFSDMPTTLEGVSKAIDMFLKKGHIGKSDIQEQLEKKELNNFKSVLQLLINQDSFCKEYVKIEYAD